MKEVFVIHGGECFATYEEYLSLLKGWRADLTDGQERGWKNNLIGALGSDFNVTLPRFPNPLNAKYIEWKIMFERYVPLLPEGSILIGHSLGGSFLVKYLSEEIIPISIRATILVAPPFDMDGDRNLVDFAAPASLDRLVQQGGDIHLIFSEDDAVVPFTELKKYKAVLPSAMLHIFSNRGHFKQEEFPELVELIRSF